MTTQRKGTWEEEKEHIAMNIVYQIGDALSEAKANDFVGKRQETNDMCIDFVKKFLHSVYFDALAQGRREAVEEIKKRFREHMKLNGKGTDARYWMNEDEIVDIFSSLQSTKEKV